MRHILPKTKAVILLSGGIDSTTTLYLAKKYGYNLNALIFDYKQRHKKEIASAVKIAKLNRINYHIVKISLPWTKSALTRREIKVPKKKGFPSKREIQQIPSTYVSGRNIIFLSYAVSFAESIQAKKIFIGAHIQDYSGYPDCRPEFIKAMERAVNLGIKEVGIEIVTPLINKNKKEIIKLGNKLGVPFEYTWSCYQGGKYPCHCCDSCRFREYAFSQLGWVDPLLKKV